MSRHETKKGEKGTTFTVDPWPTFNDVDPHKHHGRASCPKEIPSQQTLYFDIKCFPWLIIHYTFLNNQYIFLVSLSLINQ